MDLLAEGQGLAGRIDQDRAVEVRQPVRVRDAADDGGAAATRKGGASVLPAARRVHADPAQRDQAQVPGRRGDRSGDIPERYDCRE